MSRPLFPFLSMGSMAWYDFNSSTPMPVIAPKIRGFICITSHPDGCAANVQSQIDYVKAQPALQNPAKKVLVIGSSTGYGLASRIVTSFGGGASTIGVFFEKPGNERKPGSAGWYNSVAFEKAADKEGIYAKSFNGDAFSHDMKKQVIEAIKQDLGQIDMVVYSLASPRRTDPDSGETHNSCLKPIGDTYTNKTLNTDKAEVDSVSIEPASEQEVADTVKVMGGEDWKYWISALDEAGALADGFKAVAYSYIGPEMTWPIYTNGTIGAAKKDIDQTAADLCTKYGENTAVVSINKALVTQASSAIPVVPLYISLLYKVMKEKGTHEGCIEQMQRLFATYYGDGSAEMDELGRVRVDDWEMDADVQAEVDKLWQSVNTENLKELSDFNGYQDEFLRLFGFGLDGVDYTADVDPSIGVPSIG